MKRFHRLILMSFTSSVFSLPLLAESLVTDEKGEQVLEKTESASPSEQQGSQSNWLLGIQYADQSSIYTDTANDKGFQPFVVFMGEHFYWKGYEVGYRINERGATTNLALSLDLNAYEVALDESSDEYMDLLSDRDASIMAKIDYQYGPFNLGFSHDVSNEHDGYQIDLGFKAGHDMAPFKLKFEANLAYLDQNLSQHLYGFSQAESDLTSGEIESHDASASQVLSLNFEVNYMLSPSLILGMSLEPHYYFSVDTSPLVENKEDLEASMRLVYRF